MILIYVAKGAQELVAVGITSSPIGHMTNYSFIHKIQSYVQGEIGCFS